jgi:sulfite reductase alpha subunit-like flavoprotein
MRNFWKFLLKKELCEDSLCDVNYTIFGLGDSSYEKFNYVAKMLNNRLRQLSANIFHPIGLGDDQHDFGYEGEFDPWCRALIEILNEEFFPQKKLIYEKLPITPKLKIKSLNRDELREEKIEMDTVKDVYIGTLKNLYRLTSEDSFKDVLHMEIVNDKIKSYSPGDIALIYPENEDENVTLLLQLLNLNKDEIINLESNDKCKDLSIDIQNYPKKISYGSLFKYWLNIQGIPNRHFCRVAAEYTDVDLHKQKLLMFASKTSEGKDEFYRYCVKERRSYVEFLQDFKSVKIPFEILIELIGKINPREYSISSSNKLSPSSVYLKLIFILI